MAKRTLLNMTQNILSAMSSDPVNNIDDTTEAQQVAEIIYETYEEMMSQRNWPHLNRLFDLAPIGSTSYPTTFVIPDEASELEWIKYNKKDSASGAAEFEDVMWLEPKEFIDFTSNRRSDDPNVDSVTEYVSGVPLLIVNDHAPSYYTSFDEKYIVMDSYDSALEGWLQQSKVQAMASKNTSWTESNSFIPDLPEKMFPMLLAEAKETAMINIKQMVSNKEATRARRQSNTMQHRAARTNRPNKWKGYGRKRTH